ncbi:hypothetical protein M153_11600012468 [Pseudoloma neurophilia]|uniref:Uncharacterized protein n=1 Tax=Pseudoloma neurophilia TaxID=146866 RepID=A0A0R0M063_9MICR|nr:hypothetical protein M153_11600012468 [Pseudoloma neurophilia]
MKNMKIIIQNNLFTRLKSFYLFLNFFHFYLNYTIEMKKHIFEKHKNKNVEQFLYFKKMIFLCFRILIFFDFNFLSYYMYEQNEMKENTF